MKRVNGLAVLVLGVMTLSYWCGCTTSQSYNVVRSSGVAPRLEERFWEYACNSKIKEDGFVAQGGEKVANCVIKANPQYLLDVNALTVFANEIRAKCRPEEVMLVDAALQECQQAITSGTEQERIEKFRKLHEFKYRIALRKAWQAALRAARGNVRKN